jgi:hypothetical protein
MSISIYYRIPNKGHYIQGTSSFFHSLLQIACVDEGENSITLNAEDHLDKLKGFAIGLSDKVEKKSVEELIEIIEQHESVEVYAQY